MTIQADAFIDPDTGDLPAVTRLVTGIELIQQRIRLRLQRGKGEWFLDPNGTGLPFLQWRQMKPPRMAEIVGAIEAEIRAVPGIVATAGFAGEHDPVARSVRVTGEALAANGQATAIVVLGSTDARRNAMPFGVFFASGNLRGGVPRPTSGRP